jgi:hypothetical protein
MEMTRRRIVVVFIRVVRIRGKLALGEGPRTRRRIGLGRALMGVDR